MLCNTLKKWVICIRNIVHRKRKLVATKTWGIIMVDTYPFLSAVFLYNNQTVRIRLYCKLTRDVFTYEFSCRRTIIDDHMLYLQSQQHTRNELEKKGYTHAKY